jgi:CRISPR system Cascade subunit CasA
MNLTTDPWIPVVWSDGSPGQVSLRGAFEHGEEIRDLSLRPHERIAVMRLLICIAQSALDGPQDREDWEGSRRRLALEAIRYLAVWKDRFELFGDGPRFLQVPNLRAPNHIEADEEADWASVSKLDLALATGNNATLFDNRGGANRAFPLEQCALMLLTFQCFSPGGRIGVASWNGQPTPGNGSSNHAPCLAGAMLLTLVRDRNLLGSIHRNLITKQSAEQVVGHELWGRPVWERMPKSAEDREAVFNATETYLGRLVPLPRAIRLAEDCTSLLLANALSYPSFEDGWREPWATVVRTVVKNKEARKVLRASLDRGIWRELPALTVRGTALGGPAALGNLDATEGAFDLWVGGLVSDKAKPLGTVESVFHLPSAMLEATSQRVYEAGVQYAEFSEGRVRRAVSAYRRELADNLDRGDVRDRRDRIQSRAVGHYWTDVEQHVPELLNVAENPERLGTDRNWSGTEWGRAVWRAASTSYERACPHETVRQIRAFALGRKVLLGTNSKEVEHSGEEVAA